MSAAGVPGISTQGTGQFQSLSNSPASNVTSDTTPVSPTSGNPIQPSAGAGSGASAGTAPSGTAPAAQGGSGTGGGAPVDLTNAPQIGDQAAGTIAKGATTAANTVSKSLGGVTSGLGSDTSSIESTGTGGSIDLWRRAKHARQSGFHHSGARRLVRAHSCFLS